MRALNAEPEVARRVSEKEEGERKGRWEEEEGTVARAAVTKLGGLEPD